MTMPKNIGVIDLMLNIPGEDNRGCYNRAGQRTSTGFIDAGDRRDTKSAQSAFMPETTATVHLAT